MRRNRDMDDHLQAGQRGAGLRRVVVLGDDLDHSGFVAVLVFRTSEDGLSRSRSR